eukprot:COSAG02_NODE_1466_length_12483_cov_37.157703_5_plen_311_part_00
MPAHRIDNTTALGPGTILPTVYDTDLHTIVGLGASTGENVALMTVAECGGEPEDQKWILNADGFLANNATNTCINAIGDAWGHCRVTIYDSCRAVANTTGADGKCVAHSIRWRGSPLNTSTGQLVSSDGSCATQQSDKTVKLSTCISPTPATQTWQYDATSKELTTGDGAHCVTASNPKTTIKPITLVVGRPLGLSEPHAYAMVFLNNQNASTNVTCDVQCMHNMVSLKPRASAEAVNADALPARRTVHNRSQTQTYKVEEVWSGGKALAGVGPIECTRTSCDPLTVTVASHGGAIYVRLVPTTMITNWS